jgi:hypothetical protein
LDPGISKKNMPPTWWRKTILSITAWGTRLLDPGQ